MPAKPAFHGLSRRSVLARLASGTAVLAGCADDAPAQRVASDAGSDATRDVGGSTDGSSDGSGGGARPLRVGIVGGGLAGVTTAWLLDSACETVIFESRAELGGNVRSEPIEIDGQSFIIDMGAQYFNPGPYPTYTRLLDALGIRVADDLEASGAWETPSTITVSAVGGATPLFVSPLPPDRNWALTTDWNADGVNAFAIVSAAARRFERQDGDFMTTLEDWLGTLSLTESQREEIVIPWVAALFSGSLDDARQYSARATMTFLALADGDGLLETVKYSTLKRGMIEVIATFAEECANLTVHTSAAVTRVTRGGRGWLVEAAGGIADDVDVLVFATPSDAASAMLAEVEPAAAVREVLGRIEFHDARLALHTDPIYAPADEAHWSFVNVLRDGDFSETSMWMAAVVAPASDGTPANIWKSWISHRSAQPANVVHTEDYRHLKPTIATLQGQNDLEQHQGVDNLFFAGGWTFHSDSQETALLSAMAIADALELGETERMAMLRGT